MFTLFSKFFSPYLQTTDSVLNDATNTQSATESFNLFNVPIFDPVDLSELLLRFGINLFFAVIIICFIYYPFNNRNREHLFTLFLFNTVIFFVCALMRNINVQIGFAFGLFALFGLLRYRTVPVPLKDLTYLFILICIGMINAMFYRRITYAEFISANILLIVVAFILEKVLAYKKEHSKQIEYEKIDLIKPEKYNELIDDLKKRTGLNIYRIHIERVNFMRDTARIIVYYHEEKNDKKK